MFRHSLFFLLLAGTFQTLAPGPPVIDKTFKLNGIGFQITTTGQGSINRLTVTPAGLREGNDPVTLEIDGTVVGMETADLNRDGSPELYIFISSAGSGSYGRLVAFSVNRMSSMSGIHLEELDPKARELRGYMGHDRFELTDKYLIRIFPIYKKEDPNCCPSGGTRRIYYELVPGEAVWQLKRVKSETLLPEKEKKR